MIDVTDKKILLIDKIIVKINLRLNIIYLLNVINKFIIILMDEIIKVLVILKLKLNQKN